MTLWWWSNDELDEVNCCVTQTKFKVIGSVYAFWSKNVHGGCLFFPSPFPPNPSFSHFHFVSHPTKPCTNLLTLLCYPIPGLIWPRLTPPDTLKSWSSEQRVGHHDLGAAEWTGWWVPFIYHKDWASSRHTTGWISLPSHAHYLLPSLPFPTWVCHFLSGLSLLSLPWPSTFVCLFVWLV